MPTPLNALNPKLGSILPAELPAVQRKGRGVHEGSRAPLLSSEGLLRCLPTDDEGSRLTVMRGGNFVFGSTQWIDYNWIPPARNCRATEFSMSQMSTKEEQQVAASVASNAPSRARNRKQKREIEAGR